MARSTAEWKGATPDSKTPPRVRDRLRDKHPNCYLCSLPFVAGDRVALDHVQALVNGGENKESNLRPVHIRCHATKTAEDVAEKAKVAAKRKAARGIVDAKPVIQGKGFPIHRERAEKLAKREPKQPLPPRSLFGGSHV